MGAAAGIQVGVQGDAASGDGPGACIGLFAPCRAFLCTLSSGGVFTARRGAHMVSLGIPTVFLRYSSSSGFEDVSVHRTL